MSQSKFAVLAALLIVLNGIVPFNQIRAQEVTEEPPASVEIEADVTPSSTPAPSETIPEATEESTAIVEPTPDSSGESEPVSPTEPPGEIANPPEATPEVISVDPVTNQAPVVAPIEAISTTAGATITVAVEARDDSSMVRLAAGEGLNGVLAVFTPGETTRTEEAVITSYTIEITIPDTATGLIILPITAIDADGAITEASFVIQVLAPDAETTPAVETTEEPALESAAELGVDSRRGATEYTERLIQYDPTASEEAIQNMLVAMNAIEYERLPQIGAMRIGIRPDTGLTLNGMRSAMSTESLSALSLAGLQAIEENGTYQKTSPNDPDYGYQWGHNTNFGIYWENAWNISPSDGAGVVVAVIDSGVDLQHPDLTGQFVPGYDFVDDDTNPDDACDGHGTLVASIIAAKTNNGLGMAGVAPRAKIMPVRTLDCSGFTTWFDAAASVIYAVDRGADVINLSLGGTGASAVLRGAIQFAIANDVVVIAAAGNTGAQQYFYPASYDGVISVGAHDIDGNIATFSTHNDRVTLSAPGVAVYGMLPLELGGTTGAAGWEGTSFAAPYVAGVAALLVGDRIATTHASVKEALICSSFDRGAAGYDIYFGYGILQADWALTWKYNSTNCQISQPNDTVEKAMPIRRLPFTVTQAVDTRSVTQSDSDPLICGNYRPQTLWYEYKPLTSGLVNITTTGSSYDTVIGVFRGSPGRFIQEKCDMDGGPDTQSHLWVNLSARETYYIVVGSYSPISDGMMQLSINQSMFRYGRAAQEMDRSLTYTGSWVPVSSPIASGRRYIQTTDNTATVSFAMHGVSLSIDHLIGPTQGDIEVWVDDVLITILNNRAAFTDSQTQTVYLGNGDRFRKVLLKRSANGPAGPIGIDAITIHPVENLRRIAANVDDRVPQISYNGNWAQVAAMNTYQQTLTSTTGGGAFASFRANATDIAIYRMVGPGMGTMDIYVDGLFRANVSNEYAFSASVPYLITGLDPVEHHIEVHHVGGTLQIDRIKSSIVRSLPSGIATSDSSPHITYNGHWTRVPNGLAHGSSYQTTTDTNARINFKHNGNWMCLNFVYHPLGGTALVYVDNIFAGSVNTFSASTTYRNEWCSDLLPNRSTHEVNIAASLVGGQSLDFDSVTPLNYDVLTVRSGLVQETHRSLYYDGTWLITSPTAVRVTGTQGNFARTTSAGNSVSFWMEGSGFILYTTIGSGNGGSSTVGQYEIYVNGAPWDDGYGSNAIDLWDSTFPRDRGRAIGVDGLGSGFHHIELRSAMQFASLYLDFDAIRIFP